MPKRNEIICPVCGKSQWKRVVKTRTIKGPGLMGTFDEEIKTEWRECMNPNCRHQERV